MEIDGEATFCCNRPVGEITEKDIVTVEALSNDPVGAAVQEAFLAEGAAQCGYATGIVVAAMLLKNAGNAIVAGLQPPQPRCGRRSSPPSARSTGTGQ